MASIHLVSGHLLAMSGEKLSPQIRSTNINYGAEALDKTGMEDTSRVNTGGLKTVAMGHEGYWIAHDLDESVFSRIGGSSGIPISAAVSSAEGGVAYLFRAHQSEYSFGGTVGELANYSIAAQGAESEGLVRGLVLRHSTAAGGSTSSVGTAFQISASSSTRTLYGACHILSSPSNSTEDVQFRIESDASSAFGSPATRITFTATTASTGMWGVDTTASTDTWYRVVQVADTSSARYAVLVTAGVSTN